MLPAITENFDVEDEDGSSLLSSGNKVRRNRRRFTSFPVSPSGKLIQGCELVGQEAREDRYEAERTKRLALRSAALAAEEFAAEFDTNSSLAKKSRRLAEMKISDLTIEEFLSRGSFSRVYRVRLKNDLIAPLSSPSKTTKSPRSTSTPPHVTRFRSYGSEEELNTSCEVNTSRDMLLSPDIVGWNMKDVSHSSPARKPKQGDIGTFALKHLDLTILKDPSLFREGAVDLISEIKLLACLNHPNIVQIFGVAEGSIANCFQTGGGYFVLMEYLHGTLNDRIDEWIDKETSLKDRLNQAAIGLAQGLEYLHSRNVVFRDLSPHNVGFSLDGHIKLVDFGLAKEIRNHGAKLTAHTGSLRYMAPEVALGRPYGLKADQYSFAILLWEICTLHKPYEGMSKKRHRDEVVLKERRPSLARVRTESLKRLLRKCWQGRASKRPMFAEIADEIQRECAASKGGNSPRMSPRAKAVKRLLRGGGKKTRPLHHKLEDRTNLTRPAREENQQRRYVEI